jgi:hypothetical protein
MLEMRLRLVGIPRSAGEKQLNSWCVQRSFFQAAEGQIRRKRKVKQNREDLRGQTRATGASLVNNARIGIAANSDHRRSVRLGENPCRYRSSSLSKLLTLLRSRVVTATTSNWFHQSFNCTDCGTNVLLALRTWIATTTLACLLKGLQTILKGEHHVS